MSILIQTTCSDNEGVEQWGEFGERIWRGKLANIQAVHRESRRFGSLVAPNRGWGLRRELGKLGKNPRPPQFHLCRQQRKLMHCWCITHYSTLIYNYTTLIFNIILYKSSVILGIRCRFNYPFYYSINYFIIILLINLYHFINHV